MTGQQLRNSILQEAIQGRLVSNVLQPGEKPGAELLQDILAERQKKENEEKGKKTKRLSLSIIEDEPWELPDGWCWCKLGDVISLLSGRDLEPDKYNANHNGVPYITGASNFDRGTLLINRWTPKPGSVSKIGDLLITCKGTVGELAFNTIGEIHIARQIMAISAIIIDSKYIQVFLNAKVNDLNAQANGVIPGISREDILLADFPLPPLSIQKAIVKKIEELFPFVDEFEKASAEINTLNDLLPDKLRKSVLQEAIHGRLVSNDIPDGEVTAPELLQQILKERQERENKEKGKTAKILTLSTIEEEPWELPEGWCWCRIGDIADIERGGNFVKSDFVEKGYPCIHYGQIHMRFGPRTYSVLSYLPNELAAKQRKAHRGDIIMAVTSENIEDVCKCTAWLGDGDVAIGAHTAIIRHYIDPVFLVYYFKSSLFYSQKKELGHGSKVVEVTPVSLNNVILPLPPLTVQHRIVEKIEEIFTSIDELKA